MDRSRELQRYSVPGGEDPAIIKPKAMATPAQQQPADVYEQLESSEDDDMFDQKLEEENQLAATVSAEQTQLESKFVFWVTIVDGGGRRQPGVQDSHKAASWWNETKPIAKFQTVSIHS